MSAIINSVVRDFLYGPHTNKGGGGWICPYLSAGRDGGADLRSGSDGGGGEVGGEIGGEIGGDIGGKVGGKVGGEVSGKIDVRYTVSYHYSGVVTCDSRAQVTALTQNHPIGRLESPFPHGNNVAHNLFTT
jgi:hypothetical protein